MVNPLATEAVTMPELLLDTSSATPVYRQIVEQVRFLVEGGGLAVGERLPPVRELADSLGVNPNTVARAYATLRELGLVETRGAAGTTVAARMRVVPRTDLPPVGPALRDAVREAVRSGLTPEEVRDSVFALAQGAAAELRVVFVECSTERATAFAGELSRRLATDVRPALIGELDDVSAGSELVITTFFHLAEVRRWAHVAGRQADIVAVVVAPHLRTLAKVAELPAGARVGVRYSTAHQAEQVRDWLAEASAAEVVVVPHDVPAVPAVPADLAMLVVPSEDAGLGAGAAPGTEVVEFGNVLDEGAIRMVADVMEEIRTRP